MLSTLVTLYLFLGGTGAGACVTASVAGLLCPREAVCALVPARGGMRPFGAAERAVALPGRRVLRAPDAYRRLLVPSFTTAFGFIAVGAACLALDLGRIDRITLLFTSPALTHIAVGAWALLASAACAAALACAWGAVQHRWPDAVVRAIEIAAVASGAATMAYTGLLLQSIAAVPLWTSPWVPALFVLSSLSCGIALILAVSRLTGSATAFSRVMARAMKLDLAVIALEIVATVGFAMGALHLAGGVEGLSSLLEAESASAQSAMGAGASSPTSAAAAMAAANLLGGKASYLFWGGFATVGLAAPLVMEAAFLLRVRNGGQIPDIASAALSACVLIGGCVLRFCLVEAGMHPIALLPTTL